MYKNKNAIEHKIHQGSVDWHQLRIEKITSTLTPKIKNGCSESAKKSYFGQDVFMGNSHTHRGNVAEPLLLNWVFINALEMGQNLLDIQPTLTDGVFLASLDGITDDYSTIIECKCPDSKDSKTYKSMLSGKIDSTHFWQIQHALMVSGSEKCIYAIGLYNEEENIVYDVLFKEILPCEETITKIKANAQSFIEELNEEPAEENKKIGETVAYYKKLAKENENKAKEIIDSLPSGNYGVMKIGKETERENVDWKSIVEELSVDEEIIIKHTHKKIVKGRVIFN